MSKFVGFGCDGASNVMGCKTGLGTHLQECYHEVVGVQCLCLFYVYIFLFVPYKCFSFRKQFRTCANALPNRFTL